MTDNTTIPHGFMPNAKGHLVPINAIKEIDLMRDDLVKAKIQRALELKAQLEEFKRECFGDIAAFVQLSAEEYGVFLGGKKGNTQLLSFDGRFKLQRSYHDNISFDERLQAAQELIQQCLKDWSSGARDELITLINDAFKVDDKGNVSVAKVLGLRRYSFEDERWHRAMAAISDACQIISSSSYVRFYERIGNDENWQAISLDISKL